METTYEITGVDVYGRRFKIVTTNAIHALGINLYRGTLWERRGDGPRRMVYRAWN